MSDQDQNPPAGDDNSSSGTGDDPKPNASALKAHADRLLSEKKALAAKLKAADDELAAFRLKEKEAEDKKLLDAKNYEELAAREAKKNADLASENANLKAEKINDRKLAAIIAATGVVPKYFHNIDPDKVEIDTSGKIDQASLAKYVDEYKKEYPETLAAARKAPPTDAPGKGSGAGKITHAEWAKLPTLAERKKRMGDIDPSSM